MTGLYVQVNNDFSGSSYALSAIIKAHSKNTRILMSSFNSTGFLSDVEVEERINVDYKFEGRSVMTALRLLMNWFFGVLRFLRLIHNRRIDYVYLNTIHPWHIAVIAKLLRIEVIYHVHEYYINKNLLARLFERTIVRTASKINFVSEYCKSCYDVLLIGRKIETSIQYTPVRYSIVRFEDINMREKLDGPIIMICSPKQYKGVEKFIDVARYLPTKSFRLFMSGYYPFKVEIPDNVQIILEKTDFKDELRAASVLLSLTQFPEVIETYGLTICEGMSQGTPVLVPYVGGPNEIVNESCGIRTDVRNVDLIVSGLQSILNSPLSDYTALVKGALVKSNDLLIHNFIKVPE